jgi:putative ABC transport system permease protein
MRTVLQDLRFCVRQLLKLPGFTVTAVVSLALGIGATTAVFSIIYAVIFDPYPYAAPDRMIHLRLVDKDGQPRGWGMTTAQWQQFRKLPVIEDSIVINDWNLTITGSDVPEDVSADFFSSNGFEFFGVPAALGRNLQPSDAIDGEDPEPVVVLSNKFWRRHFNGDPSIVGKPIQLVHKNYTVVGVAAERFTWNDSDVYIPLKITGDQTNTFEVEARLRPGITHAQAEAAIQPLVEQFVRETPSHFPQGKFRIHVAGLNEFFLERLGGTLSLLFGAVALLLLIGCGNVSILLLARATTRQHEFALRAAIGARRGRIVQQLLTEALVLSLAGAGLGVLLAYKTLDMIVANLPRFSFPHEAAIRINVPVLAFTVAVGFATGLIFGLWPAIQLAQAEPRESLQSGTRKMAGSVRGQRMHTALIGGQIALTLLLLAGAGGAIEGFVRMLNLPLGYDPHNIMSVGIPVHENTYKTLSERAAYFERLRVNVAEVPGVTMAAISTNATPPDNGNNTSFQVLGSPSLQDQPARLNMVSHEYFPALRIGLAHGRIWNADEDHRAATLAVVNETFARRYFPNADPVGHSVKFSGLRNDPPYAFVAPGGDGYLLIVGVIVDKRNDGLGKPVLPEAFVPYTLAMRMWTQILVRSQVPPLSLLHAVQLKVNSVDHDQQTAGQVQNLEQWIENQPEWARSHLISWLFAAFAVLALTLAAVGLYSVVSYTVVQRTSEFGIRIALGARPTHVLSMVFRSMTWSVAGGIVAGIVLTLALSKVMAHWTEGTTNSSDPLLVLGAAAVLAAVAALACMIPARRAAGTDPMSAIRYE